MEGEVDDRTYVRKSQQHITRTSCGASLHNTVLPLWLILLKSRLQNGKQSGFIHMKTHKGAIDAVAAINRTRLPNSEECLMAKLQSLHPVRQVQQWEQPHKQPQNLHFGAGREFGRDTVGIVAILLE